MALRPRGCHGSGCYSKNKRRLTDKKNSVSPVELPALGGMNYSIAPATTENKTQTELPVNQLVNSPGGDDPKIMPSFLPGRLFAVIVLVIIGLIYNYSQK